MSLLSSCLSIQAKGFLAMVSYFLPIRPLYERIHESLLACAETLTGCVFERNLDAGMIS